MFCVAIFVCASSVVKASEVSTEKKELIDKLLEQTGQSASAVGKQMSTVFVQQMASILKQSNPDIDPKAYVILEEEVIKLMDEELTTDGEFFSKMYPIYDKYFTASDLKEMIQFNDTELGRKIIKVMPLLTKESMEVGQEWGMSLSPKIQKRLTERFKEEGIE